MANRQGYDVVVDVDAEVTSLINLVLAMENTETGNRGI